MDACSRDMPQSDRGSARFAGAIAGLCGKEHQMSALLRRTLELIYRDDGPTTVEYAVLLALIAITALVTMATFGQRLDGIYAAIRGAVETV